MDEQQTKPQLSAEVPPVAIEVEDIDGDAVVVAIPAKEHRPSGTSISSPSSSNLVFPEGTLRKASCCYRHKKKILATAVLLVATAIVLVILFASAATRNWSDHHYGYGHGDGSDGTECTPDKTGADVDTATFHQFSTCQELATSLRKGSCGRWDYWGWGGDVMLQAEASGGMADAVGSSFTPTPASARAPQSSADGYSGTNNQVQGVDEADLVKAGPDGKKVYTISTATYGSQASLVITQVEGINSSNSTRILGRLGLGEYLSSPQHMFVYGSTVLVLGTGSFSVNRVVETEQGLAKPVSHSFSTMTAVVVDASEAGAPVVVRRLDLEGRYITARLIGESAHIAVQSWPHGYSYDLEDEYMTEQHLLPLYRDVRNLAAEDLASASTSADDASIFVGLPTPAPQNPDDLMLFNPVTSCSSVRYASDINVDSFVTIVTIPLGASHLQAQAGTTLLAGRGDMVFASTTSIFVAAANYNYDHEHTTIMEFNVPLATQGDAPNAPVSFVGGIVVPGTLDSQFAMDEHNNHLRLATTRREYAAGIGEAMWRLGFGARFTTTNEVHVFSPPDHTGSRHLVGSLLELAPGEHIKSVRFMGDRAFLVTFRTVDPLFAIDMSDPANPIALGELKLPGYSEYLHPVNATHLLGFGRDTGVRQNSWGESTVNLGLKMTLFDVSDMMKPIDVFSVLIGDQGTSSDALYDHKAFFYDDVEKMVVVPVSLSLKSNPQASYGTRVFVGAFAYRVGESSFELAATMTHNQPTQNGNSFNYRRAIKRTLLLRPPQPRHMQPDAVPSSGTLVTVSDTMLLAVNLPTMHATAAVELLKDEVVVQE